MEAIDERTGRPVSAVRDAERRLDTLLRVMELRSRDTAVDVARGAMDALAANEADHGLYGFYAVAESATGGPEVTPLGVTFSDAQAGLALTCARKVAVTAQPQQCSLPATASGPETVMHGYPLGEIAPGRPSLVFLSLIHI